MPEPILHHFPVSPFSEKLRLVLGYKRLDWASVPIPAIAPKPDVVALTGGYRRTPLLQIGADIYCDTALICEVLEQIAPQPGLYPKPGEGLARVVAQWADSSLFWAMIAGPRPEAHNFAGGAKESAQAFMDDRGAMFAGMQRAKPQDAAAARKSYLRRLSDMLHTNRYLLGDTPCIADFSAYHPLWFSRIREPVQSDMLRDFPALGSWMDRMQAIGHGRSAPSTSAQAIAVAARSEPAGPGQGPLNDSEWIDEHGIAPGSMVSVTAESFGPEPSVGVLVAATRTHYSLRRSDPRAGTVHVHFPRVGYVLNKV